MGQIEPNVSNISHQKTSAKRNAKLAMFLTAVVVVGLKNAMSTGDSWLHLMAESRKLRRVLRLVLP